jgi:hypothetical protein
MWFNILKTQETISDMGFDFDLPEEEPPEEEDNDCCENAYQKFLSMHSDLKTFWHDLSEYYPPPSEKEGGLNHPIMYATEYFLVNPRAIRNRMYDDTNQYNNVESFCLEFYVYLTKCWRRLGKHLAQMPTTTQDLWRRGHKIKEEIHDIMEYWENCEPIIDKVFDEFGKMPGGIEKGFVNMMDEWKSVLKTQQTITDVGFDFDLPEEEPPEKDDDNECCEELSQHFHDIIYDATRSDHKMIKNGAESILDIIDEEGLNSPQLDDKKCEKLEYWVDGAAEYFWDVFEAWPSLNPNDYNWEAREISLTIRREEEQYEDCIGKEYDPSWDDDRPDFNDNDMTRIRGGR